MARDFDGVNDNIGFGSDASIDGFATQTICMWLRHDVATGQNMLLKDTAVSNWSFRINSSHLIIFDKDWDGATKGTWRSTTGIGTTVTHVAVTYDSGSTANDPIFYLNGAVDTTVEILTPAGTAVADAAQNLIAGENAAGSGDYDGAMGCVIYHNAVLTAAEINRARWWGRPMGGLQVYHPFFTDKLTNEGAATANGTATGTTVAAMLTPVVIPGTAMMGMDVGW